MFKVRIDLSGWEKFSGKLSGVPFEDGVSVREVTEKEARKIGGNVRLVRLDNEAQVGTTTNNIGDIPAAPIKFADRTPDKAVDEQSKEEVVDEENVVEENKKLYTKEELETIADEKGIKGVREIAAEYDVKGVQISALIEGILGAQGK